MLKMSRSKRMLVTRLLSLLPCLFIIQYINIERANIVLNIIQFVQLPFVIIPAIRFTMQSVYMENETYKGKNLYALLLVSGMLITMNIYQISNEIQGVSTIYRLIISTLIILYILFIIYISRLPLKPVPPNGRNNESKYNDSFVC